MGFFDFIGDAVSAVGSVAQQAGRVVNAIPGLNFTPIGSVVSDLGALAGGGFGGLAGNLLGRAQQIAPLAGGILGAPQLGGVAAGLLGGARGVLAGVPSNGPFLPVVNPGALAVGGDPTRPYGAPNLGSGTAALLNMPGRTQLPTNIPIRAPGTSLSIGGPYGLNYSSGGGGSAVSDPAAAGCVMSYSAQVAAQRRVILQAASLNAGMRLTLKRILRLLFTFGLQFVLDLTKLQGADVAFLLTTKPHRGRRGVFLKTVAKRARQVQGYRHRIARIAQVLGAVRHSRAPAGRTFRRRARR